MADIVAHIHTNLLPSVETEVTLLQKDLVLGVFHGFDDTHDFTLQFHQGVDVSVDFFLQVDNLEVSFTITTWNSKTAPSSTTFCPFRPTTWAAMP